MNDDADLDQVTDQNACQLRVVIAGISPLIWRRVLVPGDDRDTRETGHELILVAAWERRTAGHFTHWMSVGAARDG